MKVIRYMIEMKYPVESPDGETTTRSELHQRVLPCRNEADFETKMVIAKAEAYGKVTVEEVPDEETEPTNDELMDILLGVSE